MNSTPFSNRFYIGIFGCCNTGKSSLINAITNQNIAITSKFKGTTTDAVFKAMEIPKVGPCVLVDTPGFDDENEKLGKKRIEKSFEILNYVNAAIFIIKNEEKLNKQEENFLKKIKQKKIPLILVINKIDINKNNKKNNLFKDYKTIKVSSKTKENIYELINLMSNCFNEEEEKTNMISDLINPSDIIVLVIAIDESYPKERLILPQQQLIHDILKKGGICYVLKDSSYENFIKNLNTPPKLVVTDSQIFSYVFSKTDKNILITSFSILLARKKGILKTALKGVKILEKLENNDNILILESCTHKKNSCDIGSVKIPNWIEKYTNKKLNFYFLSGDDFEPLEKLKKYKLVIHCGGCMTTAKKIQNKFRICEENNISITNYGILIAYLNNVLEKSISFLNKLK